MNLFQQAGFRAPYLDNEKRVSEREVFRTDCAYFSNITLEPNQNPSCPQLRNVGVNGSFAEGIIPQTNIITLIYSCVLNKRGYIPNAVTAKAKSGQVD